MMLDVVLIVVAAAMAFATSRHVIAVVRRERVLRQMHAALEDAGKRHMTDPGAPQTQIERQ
jgi:hypothetical protein